MELENGLPLASLSPTDVKESSREADHPMDPFSLVYTMEERWWPITLAQFREVNGYLADHLPRIHKDDAWDAIRYFYEEVVRQSGGVQTDGADGEGGHGECTTLFRTLNIFYFLLSFLL